MDQLIFRAALLLLLFTGEAFGQFAGGSGTEENPYQIATLDQLQEIKNFPGHYFIQTENIDAGATQVWNEGKGFEPIGNAAAKFTGTYDGNNFRITGLYINRPEKDHVGLFGYVNGGIIKNVMLEDVEVIGANNTGALAGFSLNGRISNTSIEGTVTGKTHVGGLMGFNYGEISSSSFQGNLHGHSYVGGVVGFNRHEIITSNAKGNISGTGNGIGGLVGNNYDGIISKSFTDVSVSGSQASSFGGLVGSNGGTISKVYAKGKITGRSYVGGIAGFNRGDITEAYAAVTVTGRRNGAGGLIGNNLQGKVAKAYSDGNVNGKTQVGGLIGVNRKDAIVSEVFSLSEVSGGNDAGGLIGLNENSVKNAYWNKDLSKQAAGAGRGPVEGITHLAVSDMKGAAGEKNMKGFEFNITWGIFPDEYPKLLWNIPYFVIGNIVGSEAIVSGEQLELKVSVRNVGGVTDTNHVVLRNPEGKVIYTTQNLILASNEEIELDLGWQSTTKDKGDYEFLLQTSHDQAAVQFAVRMIPDQVEVTKPGDLIERVSLKPTFAWKEAYLAEKYQLQIASDAKFENIVYNKDGIEGLTFSIPKSLNYLTDYYWRVRGKNPDEAGLWSKVQSFTTIIEKPEVVELSEPENELGLTSTFPLLTWSLSDRAEEYQLQLSKEDEFENLVFDTTFSAPDTTYEFERELEAETEYFWRVQAKNEGGKADWSDTGTFKTMKRTSTGNSYVPVEFTLKQNYPNPFNNSTVIQFGLPESSEVLLEVLNMLGQNVATLVNEPKSPGWHSVVFDASELSSGFYLYRIKTKDFERTKKLMLIK